MCGPSKDKGVIFALDCLLFSIIAAALLSFLTKHMLRLFFLGEELGCDLHVQQINIMKSKRWLAMQPIYMHLRI